MARAIVNQPILLLADEPTGNLDSEHGNEVMQTLVQLNQEGTTILMATHSLENASYGCNAIRLHDGKIVLEKVDIEEYSDIGPLREFRPVGEQSHQLYAVLDHKGKSLDVEAGIGFGLTPWSDKVNLKLMLLWNLN